MVKIIPKKEEDILPVKIREAAFVVFEKIASLNLLIISIYLTSVVPEPVLSIDLR